MTEALEKLQTDLPRTAQELDAASQVLVNDSFQKGGLHNLFTPRQPGQLLPHTRFKAWLADQIIGENQEVLAERMRWQARGLRRTNNRVTNLPR